MKMFASQNIWKFLHRMLDHEVEFQQFSFDQPKARNFIGGYKNNKVETPLPIIIIDYKIQIEMADKKAMIFVVSNHHIVTAKLQYKF